MTMTPAQFENYLRDLPEEMLNHSYEDALRECLPLLREGVDDNFHRAEDAEGIPWPPHAPSTVKKMGPHPLLIWSWELLEACRDAGHEGHIEEITETELTFGVDGDVIPYAAVQNYGSADGVIPRREYMYASEEVLEDCERILADEFLEIL